MHMAVVSMQSESLSWVLLSISSTVSGRGTVGGVGEAVTNGVAGDAAGGRDSAIVPRLGKLFVHMLWRFGFATGIDSSNHILL